MSRAFLVMAVGVSMTLLACGKKDEAAASTTTTTTATATAPAAAKGMCNKVSAAGKCNEESGDPEDSKSGCELTHGTWTAGGTCPTDKLFANCAYGTTKVFYYAGVQPADALLQMDEQFARTDCELVSGKYTAVVQATDSESPPVSVRLTLPISVS